jgi:hypothetical protein
MSTNKGKLSRQAALLLGGTSLLGLIILGAIFTRYQLSLTGQNPLSPTTQHQPAPAWERTWLTGVPCRPPCWEGITPGQTNASEAEQLLHQLPEVGVLNQGQSVTPAPPYKSIDWESWKNSYGGGSVLSSLDTSVVFNIRLAFPHNFTLGEVIEAYGQPSHVLAMASRNLEKLNETDYVFEIYWQSKGIRIEPSQQYPPHRPVIDSNLTSHSVDFFEPGAAGLEHIITFGSPARLKFLEPWKGLVDFGEYCHPVDLGGGIDPQACEVQQP